jgi:hypothetical protein
LERDAHNSPCALDEFDGPRCLGADPNERLRPRPGSGRRVAVSAAFALYGAMLDCHTITDSRLLPK